MRNYRPPIKAEKLPKIEIVLPMWNEEAIAYGKLEDVMRQEYPPEKLRLTFVDSCSEDKTVEVVTQWEKENNKKLAHPIKKILMENRLGKSAAINLAIESLENDTEIMVMSDADARIGPGALLKIADWMSDDKIGGVSGFQQIMNENETSQENREWNYRGIFNVFRVGESVRDSTPIFEGSLAAYKVEALKGFRVIEDSNADDSQLALAARFNGFKSIMDPELVFTEFTPSYIGMSRKQKVRRAQGLVRLFYRNMKNLGKSEFRGFRRILIFESYFHLIVPWLTLLGVGLMAVNLVDSIQYLIEEGVIESLEKSILSLISLYFVICALIGKFLPLSGIIQAFFQAEISLIESQLLILSGRSLHKWEQVTETREMLHIHESEE